MTSEQQSRSDLHEKSLLEENRVHMLYTGAFRDDVDREKTLTLKQIQQVKLSQTQIEKLIMEVKENNKEKLANIKRYLYLVKEAKEHASLSEWQNIDNATIERKDDFNRISVDERFQINKTMISEPDRSVLEMESGLNFSQMRIAAEEMTCERINMLRTADNKHIEVAERVPN